MGTDGPVAAAKVLVAPYDRATHHASGLHLRVFPPTAFSTYSHRDNLPIL